MTRPVISVEHLTKRYELGVIGTGTLTRDLERWWARVRGQADPYTRIGQRDAFERIGESILALDDVSFTVAQGAVLGIIGRNGAGKSTLLKILSRVTAPTSGVVKVKGRIGSLLEVGTGFHPELTGRENIYLNGAILGMKKDEIARKFDEIVDFSGVEQFIDTPVKRYSSGMYVRLAFAVAAHLESEILIVDEVLAVGDAEFQKKCLGKMGDVANTEGRTVLFVSHNMSAIENICRKSIILRNGKIYSIGNTTELIQQYLYVPKQNSGQWSRTSVFPNENGIFLERIEIRNKQGNLTNRFSSTESINIYITVKSIGLNRKSEINIRFTNQSGVPIFSTGNQDQYRVYKDIREGRYLYHVIIPEDILLPGQYQLLVTTLAPGIKLIDKVEEITIQLDDIGALPTIMQDGRLGLVTLDVKWNEIKIS